MKLKFKKILLTALVAASVFCVAFSVPAVAASSVIDCSKLSYMRIGSSLLNFRSRKVSDFISPDAVWYEPVGADGETFTSDTDFEMHFDIGARIEAGETYTLSYDFYFPSGFKASSQIVMPGLNENYICATGSWIDVVGERFFHWIGSVTVTAGYAVSEILIIPRGLSPYNGVCVNRLTVSVAGKDYSGAIDNTKNEIKQNADKNAQDIKDNQDKNTQKQIDEDYGYQKPDSSDTDEGIGSGTSLIESLNQWIDDFNEELPTSVSHIMDDIQPFKQAVHKIFNIFPVALQYLFTFAMVFLVLRKVVGR